MDADRLVQRYNSGERNFKDASLREADLRGVDLSGADLRGANLYGVNLREANLSGADLRKANLYGADLRKACLYEADLREASLYGAELGKANLGGANLSGADLSGASLHGADLRGTDLTGALLQGTGIDQEQLAQAASLKGTTVQGSTALEPWKEIAVPILASLLSLVVTGLLPLFVALSASVFLITIDQLFITQSGAPGAISLIYLPGLVVVGAVAGACYAYHGPRKTTSAGGTIGAVMGGVAGVVYAAVNLIRSRIMLSLPGYGWTEGEIEYFFAISLGGNALFGAIAGALCGALVAFVRGQSTARGTTRVGRWPFIGGQLLIAISVCIWVVIITGTGE